MIKILFVTADPSNAGRLRLGTEMRKIKESLDLSELGHRFKLEHSPATRPPDLFQAMRTLRPDIVHFSGHGSDGAIWLENDSGQASPTPASSLDTMFEQFKSKTSCVVLNACHSRPQAQAIAPHARHVIGTRSTISDAAAIGFSVGFYQGLGNGLDVPQAFNLGHAIMQTADSSSQWIMALDTNPAGVPLDLRFASHLPVVVGMGCTTDEFKTMTRDALEIMSQYDFSEDPYRERDLSREDYSMYKPDWLPADPKEWKLLAKQSRQIIEKLDTKISGPKVYHFFIRAPICLALGLGASIGTKHEVVLHHFQGGAREACYVPVIDVSVHSVGKQGPLVLKLRPDEDRQYITVEPFARTKQNVYASLWFAPNCPAGVEGLAESDGATFIDIRSKTPGEVPLDSDWLAVAREVNTVLLGLLATGCSELHLFPSVPVPLAFAIGMGMDTKRQVVVHQWYSSDNVYHEVLRLNELGQ